MLANNSRIFDTITDILNYHVVVKRVENIYDESATAEIVEYLDALDIQWDVIVSDWPNMTGGSVMCAWIDNSLLQTMAWDFHR